MHAAHTFFKTKKKLHKLPPKPSTWPEIEPELHASLKSDSGAIRKLRKYIPEFAAAIEERRRRKRRRKRRRGKAEMDQR
jgi:hypothetical protein